jgi:Sad1 / UNC-like C-terminal
MMAPPRRTSARNASATPAQIISPTKRSTRGSSALPLDSSVTRRNTRGASQRPGTSDGLISSPNLPELQTKQSYAYGSTKTPLLPDQLVASERLTLDQISSNLNAGIREAERNFEDHAAEAGANFVQKDARAQRAERHKSKDESREGSVDSETRKTRRTAAWASSLDNSQLENISEEGISNEETPDDDETRRDTDPSSFPSGIYDHSYNYERSMRGPRAPSDNPVRNLFSASWQSLNSGLTKSYHFLEWTICSIGDFVVQAAQRIYYGIMHLFEWMADPRFTQFIMSIAFGGLVFAVFCAAFCKVYTGYLCNPDSISAIHLKLQEYCGRCSLDTAISTNLTFEERKDIAKLSKTLNALTKKIQEAEARMDEKFDAKHANLIYSLDDLGQQQRDLQLKIAHIETRQPSADYSPLMQKINYFAPGTGALVNPYRTSPTKQKKLAFYQRIFLRAAGLQKYTSNPPSSALEPWEDIGDCWCSSGTHSHVRLGVNMGHMIYPTEVVIEHYPITGLVMPDTVPRQVEIWADFEHLTPERWAELGISGLQGMDPISPTMAKIGEAVYDSTSKNNVQTFRLDVNQGPLTHHTERITVRVVSNYGADYTCLYRVRVHGVAVVPHAKATVSPSGVEL